MWMEEACEAGRIGLLHHWGNQVGFIRFLTDVEKMNARGINDKIV